MRKYQSELNHGLKKKEVGITSDELDHAMYGKHAHLRNW